MKIAGRRKRVKAVRTSSTLESGFATLWLTIAPPNAQEYHREYRFDPTRKWRFDFAWPEEKVAVELEGMGRKGKGWGGSGGHQTVAGFSADCEKYNAAAELGWCVFRYTRLDLDKRPVQVIEQVVMALDLRPTGYRHRRQKDG